MADVKGFLKGAFPFISTVASMGGPLGSMAANALGKAIGVDKVSPSADGLAQAIAKAAPAGLTGDQIAALQKAEEDFRLQMAKLGFEDLEALEKIAADDRADARRREIEAKDSWTPRILAGIVAILWGLVTWFLLKHVVPAEMREIVMRSLGTLDMALGLVLGYYFGSSAGSDRKTELLGQEQPKQ